MCLTCNARCRAIAATDSRVRHYPYEVDRAKVLLQSYTQPDQTNDWRCCVCVSMLCMYVRSLDVPARSGVPDTNDLIFSTCDERSAAFAPSQHGHGVAETSTIPSQIKSYSG